MLTNLDETMSYDKNISKNINNQKLNIKCADNVLPSEKYKREMLKDISDDTNIKNYKSNDYIYKSKINGNADVSKTFRKIVNYIF